MDVEQFIETLVEDLHGKLKMMGIRIVSKAEKAALEYIAYRVAGVAPPRELITRTKPSIVQKLSDALGVRLKPVTVEEIARTYIDDAEIRKRVLQLARAVRASGSSKYALVAALEYYVRKQRGESVTQREIARKYGVTEVTLRKSARTIRSTVVQ